MRADEWQALRDLRLRALADAPHAFETRYEEARERPDAWWVDWTTRSAAGDGQAFFLVREDGAPVGLAGTYVEEDGRRWLISMWTDPSVRGRGVGRALVDAVVDFARGAGSVEIYLEVKDGNDAARALYERCGFAVDGSGVDGDTTTMRRAL